MKLTVVLLLITLMSFSNQVFSQASSINLKMENATIVEIFQEIERTSKYGFIFKNEQLDLNKKHSIQIEGASIEEVLEKILDEGYEYTIIRGKNIIIKNKTVREKQKIPVSGKVTNESNEPIPGVTVVVEGTTQGTITDINGSYILTSVDEDAELIFSFIGMRTRKVSVAGKDQINVVLVEEMIGVEEVVVVGYGVQKKINVTGSISTVSSDELENRPVMNVEQAMQGLVPNLQINTTDGGRPGEVFEWSIRGRGTINTELERGQAVSSSSPLFIIDGVAGHPNDLNPEDIESVSVLKDAAAAAIYGSRAPYGVVIITTKRGDSENMRVTFSSSLSLRSRLFKLNQMGSLDFVEYTNQGQINRGAPVRYDESYVQDIIYHIENPDSPTKITHPSNPRNYYRNVATDVKWWDEIYKDNAITQNYNVTVSGGSKKVRYYLSLGYYDQEGNYNRADDGYKRYTGLMNLNIEATQWLDLSYKLQMLRHDKFAPNNSAQDFMQSSAYRSFPIIPVIDPNGQYDYFGRGVAQAVNGGKLTEVTDVFNNTFSFVFKPIKDFKLNGDLSYNTYNKMIVENTVVVQAYDALGNPSGYLENAGVSDIQEMYRINKFYSVNIYGSYSKQLDNHNIHVLGGYQQEYEDFNQLTGYRNHLIADDILSLNVATGDNIRANDRLTEWTTQGYFGRVSYNFMEKYLLEFNGRYDGSSRFPKEFRWGFFPSAAVGYIVSKESYFESFSNIVNLMKLRASYGRLGNTNVRDPYYSSRLQKKTSTYIGEGEQYLEYLTAPNLGNYHLTWEKPTTINLAIDLGLFNNQLDASVDWYTRKTIDMVGLSEPTPSVLGTAVPLKNNTELKGQGWEAKISYRGNIKNEFNYQLAFNISRHREKITKYYNPNNIIYNYYYEGHELGEIWGYETIGFINTEEDLSNMADQSFLYSKWGFGDIMYRDLNDDGKINRGQETMEDHGDLKIIGNSTPSFEYNFTMACDYKGFDFRAFFTGIGKTDWWPAGGQGHRSGATDPIFFGSSSNFWNHSNLEEHKDYWTPENMDAYYPRPLIGNGEGYKNTQRQTKYLQNRAYLRLKSVQLGYTIPSKITKQFMIQNARVYFSGENLLTFTNLRIFDPEVPGIHYPIQKVISAGVKVSF